MKKIIFTLFITFIFTPIVFASSNTGASIDGIYYDTLEEALNNAKDGSVIKLFSNAKLEKGFIVEKNLEINLNNNNISAPTAVFEVRKGTLKLSGKGVIKETEPNYGVVRLIGNNEPTSDKYSSVYVGKDVTLEGWAGIFVSHENGKSYGVNVNLEGKINAVNDINDGTGIGVYVNGTIKDKIDSPNINIMDGAVINSTGDGLYIGGYTTVNIGKATINGEEAGIGIKSGILNVNGATVTSNGKDYTPTLGYSNGINASGTAIQIESNTGYAGNMEINLNDGTFKSDNSYAIYEYIGKGNSTLVKKFNIKNGTFISGSDKNTLTFSKAFNDTHKGFITGGKYSTDPSVYLSAGYSIDKLDSFYTVSKSASLMTFSEVNGNNNIIYKTIISLAIILCTILVYYNRTKLIKLIQK